MLKRRRTLLCFEQGVGASATVVLCYDRGVRRGVVSSYERSKFAIRCGDFWATCKIARNDHETASHGSVLCTRGRSERGGRGVYDRRAKSSLLSSDEPKTLFRFADFGQHSKKRPPGAGVTSRSDAIFV